VPTKREDLMKNVVAIQPIAVLIEAGGDNWHHYKSGIYNGPCGTKFNHVVTIVGYGKQGRDDYWLIKNSWGANWGDQGFIKMKRNFPGKPEGLCGIALQPSFPLKNKY
jgi:hypothetical protein